MRSFNSGISKACQILGALILVRSSGIAAAQSKLLNVSYDVSCELYKDINTAFAAQWLANTKEKLVINQSHGGSSAQAIGVVNGLEADVVTMNQAPDIDVLAERLLGGWEKVRKEHFADGGIYDQIIVKR